MTRCGSVLSHLASLENLRFLAAFGEGIILASVGLPLLALGSVNKAILPKIHSKTKIMLPPRSMHHYISRSR